MNQHTHLIIDGYIDTPPKPGTACGTARFDLVHSPDTDPDGPDTVLACTTGDPRITHLLLTEVQPGDLLRVTGTLLQPDDETLPAQLTVDALEILTPIPVLQDMSLSRHGTYVVVTDPDRDEASVFTEHGAWIARTADPDLVDALIDAYENGRAAH